MDLIDRQAAIDILEVAINDDWEFDYAKDRMNELHVQPEIILCKDCVHHGYKGHIPYCDIKTYGYGWKDDDFCSDAERRANE